MKRLAILLALGLSLALCGFATAAWLASISGAAKGQGLAGGAIILGYGVLGAIAGVLLVPLIYQRLAKRFPLRVLIICGLPASLVLVALLGGWLVARQKTQAHLEQAYTRLPAFRLEIERGPASRETDFQRFEADWGAQTYTVSVEGRQCQGSLSGEEAVALLTALRTAESVLYKNATPCLDSADEALQHLHFLIPEAMPPETRHAVSITADCLQQYPALASPHSAVSSFIDRCGH